MALEPNNAKHALQIIAGIEGRNRGHQFELDLAKQINSIKSINLIEVQKFLFNGQLVENLITKSLEYLGIARYDKVEAIALGAIATAEEGKKWLEVHGVTVKACKSDILISIYNKGEINTIGVSVKQCYTKNPTNAQLYFTTAVAFSNLLIRNGINVSDAAVFALRQFCGDIGYRPLDIDDNIENRKTHPERYFWEEIKKEGRVELERIFSQYQDKITKLLLQKAYLKDPFIPELVLHKTKNRQEGYEQEYALYSIDELIELSKKYSGFNKKEYSVRKGRFKDPVGVKHDAPRFGIVQMQRGGQKQHPTQLQFNLQAGYFYKI